MLEVHFDPFPVLTTKRLILRKVIATDAADILMLRSDEQAMKYIGRPKMSTIAEVQKFITVLDKGILNNEAINWAVAQKDNNQLIGNICLWQIQKEHYRAELGYMLHPAYWRKGIVTEAAAAVIHYGFNIMRLHSIEAYVNPENAASIRLLEKLDFIKEAHFKEDFFFNGQFNDTAVYSRLRN